MPGVCLSVCLSVSNFTWKLINTSLWKFYQKCMYMWTRKNYLHFESYPLPDPDPVTCWNDCSTSRERSFFTDFFPQFGAWAPISRKKLIGYSRKFLQQIHLWTRKSPVSFWSYPNPKSGPDSPGGDLRSRMQTWSFLERHKRCPPAILTRCREICRESRCDPR